MNTKIVLSTLSILASLALMAGATFASFTSNATNSGNTFAAGSLTFTVSPDGQTASTPIFNVSGALPGTTTPLQTIDLHNGGSVTASHVVIAGIALTDNNLSSGDLGGRLVLNIYQSDGSTLIHSAALNDTSWNNGSVDLGSVTAGGTTQIKASISFPTDSTDNLYQGASESFSITFQAQQ